MAKRLTYADVADLPIDHPLYVEFMKEATEQMQMDVEIQSSLKDEESQEYFDRYIAGDR